MRRTLDAPLAKSLAVAGIGSVIVLHLLISIGAEGGAAGEFLAVG